MYRQRGLLLGAVLLLLSLPQVATAQDDAVIDELHARVAKFLQDASQKDSVNRAFQELLQGSPLEKSEAVKSLGERVERFGEAYGELLESERITAKRIGRDLVVMKYLYKAKQFPVVWHFSFYRPPDPDRDDQDWLVIAVSFDTNLKLLALSQP